MRHAAAAPPSIYQLDEARTLTKAGVDGATALGQQWHTQGVCFDSIVASPALRTQLTARLVAKELGYALQDITTEPALYKSPATTLAAKLQAWPDAWQQVLVVTHLPVVQSLMTYLTGHMPTHAIAPGSCSAIRLHVAAWAQLVAGGGTML